jgi:hypothetical protein
MIAVVLAPAWASAQYMKMDPPPDVDKTSSNNSCWLATAANMLAGAGYGDGANVQDRADDIYAELVAHYTTGPGGSPATALDWWLTNERPAGSTNPYTNVTTYGTYNVPYPTTTDVPNFLGNELRECQMVGLGIIGTGWAHAITAWGDDINSRDPLPVGTSPTEVSVTDSDNELSGPDPDVNTYNYQTSGGGWYLGYSGTPMISQFWTLCPEPEGVIARGQRTIHQNNEEQDATDLHFTAYQKEDWVEILSYHVGISEPHTKTITTDDYPQTDGKVHSIHVEADFVNPIPYCTDVTIDVEFYLNEWNTVRFEDVHWTYGFGKTAIKAAPDIGFSMWGIPRDIRIDDSNENGAFGNDNVPSGTYDASDPDNGFVVIAYDMYDVHDVHDVHDVSGKRKLVSDRFVHEFKNDVLFDTHFLEMELGQDEPAVLLRNFRWGYSQGYFVDGDELAAFDNWVGTLGNIGLVLRPGESFTVALRVPEPVSMSLLLLGGPLLLRRRWRSHLVDWRRKKQTTGASE